MEVHFRIQRRTNRAHRPLSAKSLSSYPLQSIPVLLDRRPPKSKKVSRSPEGLSLLLPLVVVKVLQGAEIGLEDIHRQGTVAMSRRGSSL